MCEFIIANLVEASYHIPIIFSFVVLDNFKLLLVVNYDEHLEFVGKGTAPGIQCAKDADG